MLTVDSITQAEINDPFLLVDQITASQYSNKQFEMNEDLIFVLSTLLSLNDQELDIVLSTRSKFNLFTGERLQTKLGHRNTLRLDIMRLLKMNRIKDFRNTNFQKWISESCFNKDLCYIGECAHSMIALLRYANEVGDRKTVSNILETIKANEDGKGRWNKFPFFYTLFALSEVGQLAEDHLRYALPAVKRVANRQSKIPDRYVQRRKELYKRILSNFE